MDDFKDSVCKVTSNDTKTWANGIFSENTSITNNLLQCSLADIILGIKQQMYTTTVTEMCTSLATQEICKQSICLENQDTQ